MSDDGQPFSSTRFEILERLGQGGMGVVYSAFDKETRTRVALKTLRKLRPEALLRFKREFRALREVHHPNLVRLGELIEERGQWFFTMELIEGADVLSYLRESADPLPRLRKAMEQLAAGLIALHAAGKVHRDIKPSNVLVTDAGRLVIVDFGIIFGFPVGLRLTAGARILGSPAYMAPEQARSAPVGAPADWYSAGVILYEALTGRWPFDGARSDLLFKKVSSDPTPPRELAPQVPEDLDRLCRRLLSRDPEARPTGPEVLSALAHVRRWRWLRFGRVPELGSPRFVGRKHELARLEAALAASKDRFVCVAVEGEPGVGKSALLSAFAERVTEESPSSFVLAARGSERENVPFRAIDGAIDALSPYLRRLAPGELRELLPPGIELVVETFPVLQDLFGDGEFGEGAADRDRVSLRAGPPERREKIVQAMRAILGRLAARGRVLLSIDELQWADEDSAELLREIARPPDAPKILLLTAARAAREAPAFLVPDAERLWLEALPLDEAQEFAEQLLRRRGQRDGKRAKALSLQARGHPLLIEILANGADPHSAAPPSLDEAIENLEARLEHRARLLLRLIGLASPLTLDAAALALGAGADEVRRCAEALCTARLACLTRAQGRPALAPSHPFVAGALLASTAAGPLAEEHRSLAAALAATGGDAELVAAHQQAGDDRPRAAERLSEEAARAAQTGELERAAQLYRLALPLSTPRSLPLRRALADVLAATGRADEATTTLLIAADTAGGQPAVELRMRAVDELIRSARLGEAAAELARLLESMGERPDRGELHSRLALIAARLRGPAAAADPLRAQAAFTHALVTLVGEDCARGMLLLEASALLSPPRWPAVQALRAAAPGARAGAARAAPPSDDPVAAAARAIADCLRGHFRDAAAACEALRATLPVGSRDARIEAALVAAAAQLCLSRVGDLLALANRLEADVAAAAAAHDALAQRLFASTGALHQLARDRPAEAVAPSATASGDFSLLEFLELCARSQRALYVGEGGRALEELQAAWPRLRAVRILRVEAAHLELLSLRGRAALQAGDLGQASSDAEALARKPDARARSLGALLLAGARHRAGDAAQALRLLGQAEEAAAPAGHTLLAVAARRARGKLAAGDGGRALCDAADQWMVAQGVVAPARLAELLTPGFS